METNLSGINILNDDEILKTLSDVGVYISNYETGEFVISNEWQSLPKTFSLTEQEEDSFFKYIHPEDRDRIRNALNDVHNGKKTTFHEIYRLKYGNDSYKWIHSFGKTAKKTIDGNTAVFVGSDFDITDLKDTEEKLKKSVEEAKKRTNELETLRDIVKVISSSLELKETVCKILIQIKRLIPYETVTVQILKGNSLQIIGAKGFEDNDSICNLKFTYPEKNSLSTYVLQNNKPFLTNNIKVDFPSFTQPQEGRDIISWIGIPLISQGRIIGLLTLDGYSKNHFNKHHLDLSEIIGDHIAIALDNAVMHDKAYKMAMEDALTGLGSRHRIQIEGRLMIETAVKIKNCISIAMIDIDHFKIINDTYGHDMGDIVLKSIANKISQEIRETDLLARYGGEEFVLIMPGVSQKESILILERIRKEIESIKYKDIIDVVTISSGIYSGIPHRGQTLGHYITIADEQLYKAKSNGRNKTYSCLIKN